MDSELSTKNSDSLKVPLIWHTEKKRVSDLLPYERNPRTISEKQLNDLRRSFERFNLVEIPAIDTDGKIVAGHQRIKVMQILGRGQEEIDVRVPNRKLTKEEYEQYLLTSNATGGEWDLEILKDFDVEVLLDVGFDDSDIANIWDDSLEVEDDEFDVQKTLKEIKVPMTKPGDLYQLGAHLLLCADATDATVIARLTDKQEVVMIYCDPPYNISLDYDKGIGTAGKYGGIRTNDKKSSGEYREFLKRTIMNALSISKIDAHIFYWCDESYIGMLQRRVCLWIKNNANLTPQVAFNKVYESCIYGTIGKPGLFSQKNLNEVLNKEIGTGNSVLDDILDIIDIWMAKRLPTQNYEHPTEKPLTLHEKPLRRCTQTGDIVLDLFGGSGSTLIACEQMKRKCLTVEWEPVFCDLIVKRFEAATGEKAKLITTQPQ